MAILKSRESHPPGGFKFTQPQTNYSIPEWRSFQSGVQAIIDHRNGNPWLITEHKLSVDFETVANELDEFNAANCVANEWFNFVQENNSPKLFPPRPFQPRNAAAGVRHMIAGVKTLSEWLGDGLAPVDQVLADTRASICKGCPQNGAPNWLQTVDAGVANYVKTLIEIRNNMKLSTSLDADLHTCLACDCYLPLKVWTPLEHVRKNTSAEVNAKLDPRCWVILEQS